MVKKKLLTIDDLVQFCMQNKLTKFSAKEYGQPLAVQVPTTFEIEDNSDDNHRGMMRLKFRILHDGLNRNKSFVSHKSAVKASATIADRPILAAIHQLDDGTWDFKSHEMEIIENDEGEPEINYIEKQVGSFSSEKPFWEHDDETDKDYLCAYGYIPEEYTKAADIIRAKGWTKNSCELVIEDMSFNAKEKQLELNSFYLSGSTLLGRDDDGTPIEEGMLGSRADIADFSKENNSVFSQNEMVIEMLSALNEKIDNLNINQNTSKKGGTEALKKEFDEQAEEEIKGTPSTENFDGEDGNDGTDFYQDSEGGETEGGETEGETEGQSEGGEGNDPVDTGYYGDGNNEGEGGNDSEPSTPVTEDEGDDDDDEDEGELTIPLGQRDDDDTAGSKKYSVELTINTDNGKKTFSTMMEKLNALYELVNSTYSDADNDIYSVDADEEKKVVEMHQWFGGKHYRQSYSVKKDIYSLVGDRVETYAKYLTEDEIKSLENMKSNYASIESKLAQYESEPDKIKLLESEDYAQIKDTEAYANLAKRDTYFSMSKEELEKELDKCLLEFAKHNKIEFDADESKKKDVGVKLFGNLSKKGSELTQGRYGGIFKK